MKADDQSLSRLMAAAQAGDAVAYRTVLDACQKWLTGYYARRIAPSFVEDLIQETLISIHNKRASYDPSRPFLPWLAAIARYRWVDQLRRSYRAAETELTDVFGIDPEDEAVMARISIDRLLAMLPGKQAQAIRMVKIEGLSIIEAAEKSGQSEPLIKVNVHRGLKKLAQLIESE
jgi:RNA polymerase sigma factor (sigma-70 family)